MIPLLLACGGDARKDIDFADSGSESSESSAETSAIGGTVSSGEDTSTSESSPSSSDTWDEEASDDDSSFPTPDTPIDKEKCTAIDFLFVIDNSGSMREEQDALIASFPGFINGIESAVPTASQYHVGVTATEAYEGNPPSCRKMGAMVSATLGQGEESSDSICGPYAGGHNFMTDSDELNEAFPCAAQLGVKGQTKEQPLRAAVSAVDLFIQSPGQCNEGFLRDDALLVIVIITDEDDQSDIGPQDWYDELVWLKGTQDDIVVLSLTVNEDCPNAQSEKIIDFTNMFTHGYIGAVCAESYDSFFFESLAVVQDACSPPVD